MSKMTKLNLDEVKKEIYSKLNDPQFLYKAGVSISCGAAILSLILSDFGMLKDTFADGSCCYSNCYTNCYSCW